MALRNRAHDRGGKRCNADGHAESKNKNGGKQGSPVAAADVAAQEERKAGGGNGGADDQRYSGAEASNEATGPSGENEHEHDERQQGCARLCGCVVLDLNEIERKEEEDSAQSG